MVCPTQRSLRRATGFWVWGPLPDHVGRRPVTVGGLVVLSLVTNAVGVAPSVVNLGCCGHDKGRLRPHLLQLPADPSPSERAVLPTDRMPPSTIPGNHLACHGKIRRHQPPILLGH